MVSPDEATSIAFWMVLNGAPMLPGEVSIPDEDTCQVAGASPEALGTKTMDEETITSTAKALLMLDTIFTSPKIRTCTVMNGS